MSYTEEMNQYLDELNRELDEADARFKEEYNYSDELYSDLFKDVNGFRPRGQLWEQWCNKTPADKQKEWNYLCNQL